MPASPPLTADSLSCAPLAPVIAVPLRSHWYDNAAVPCAETANTASLPMTTVSAVGCEVMVGATAAALTDRVTASLAVVPAPLVASSRNCLPLSARVTAPVVKSRVVTPLPPLAEAHAASPAARVCHCSAGLGVPFAWALKFAVCPGWTSTDAGCCVKVGTVAC